MSGRVYHVVVDGDGRAYRVELFQEGTAWRVVVECDGERHAWPLEPGAEPYRVRVGTRPVELDGSPVSGVESSVFVDGLGYRATVRGAAAQRLVELGIGARAPLQATEIRAPMPGLVLAVEVAEGDRVEAGDGVAIVEAMKMENEITAPVAGIVRDLAVRDGETVERGALVCRIDPGGAGAETTE